MHYIALLRIASSRFIAVWMLCICGFWVNAQSITGYVIDSTSREAVIGVTVADSSGHVLTYTNESGYFSVPRPTVTMLRFSHVGYAVRYVAVMPSRQKQPIFLTPRSVLLTEVNVVTASDNGGDGSVRLSATEIKRYPSVLGEKDLIKIVQTLPGVKRIVEGGSGFSVRGGGADQNLVTLDGVPLYSYNHLFGLFSMFNTDAVKDVEFIKNGISARYGGRSSSVLNVRLKDGNVEKWEGQGTIGLLSAKVSANGPIVKGKTALLVSARRSYIDALTKPFMSDDYKQGYVLGDYAVKLHQLLSTDSRLTAGFYQSTDAYSEERTQTASPTLRFYAPVRFSWKNTLGYVHYAVAGKQSFTGMQLYTSRYRFNYTERTDRISNDVTTRTNQLEYDSFINDVGVKVDHDLNLSQRQSLRVGAGMLRRSFLPRSVNRTVASDGNLATTQATIDPEINYEGHAYAELRQQLTQKMVVTVGLRSVYWYRTRWKLYAEPRLSIHYALSAEQTLHLSYFKINQFVHLLSTTGGSLPTDLWVTALDRLKPQQSEQVSIGYSTPVKKRFWFEIDLYYKRLSHMLMYKEGASFLNLTAGLTKEYARWEDALTVGNGQSYGLEILTRKNIGKLQYLASYTLSRTTYTFSELNRGRSFFPKFDRLHDFSLNLTYPFTKRVVLSAAFVAGTGSPVTLPNGIYQADVLNTPFNDKRNRFPAELAYYSGLNNYRSEAYHRLDVGASFPKKKKRMSRTWEVSIFNVYAHKNPFNYGVSRISTGNGILYAHQKQSYLTIVPSVSYSVQF